MRARKLVECLLAASLVLAGCVSIPNSGPVQSISPSTTGGGAIGLTVQPPAKGATPKQIVDGFLLASQGGIDDNFAVAREFLYSDAASNWKPLARVHVYPDSQEVSTTVLDNGAVRASVSSQGTVSSRGVYTETANGSVITSEFSLAKNEDGEWRIVALDDGIYLSEHIFGQLFVESPLYFLAPDSQALVPDMRYFPRRTAATSAINELLAGPSDWLATGVHTAVPEGTELLKSVDVVDGVATVDFSSEVLSTSNSQRANMFVQIRRTLSAGNSVRSVNIKVEGADVTGVASKDISNYPYGSYPITVLSEGLPSTVSGGRISPLVTDPDLAGRNLTDIAVSYESGEPHLAVLGNNRTELIGVDAEKGSWATLAAGASLTPPSYDRYGWAWVAESQSPDGFTAVNPEEGRSERLAVPWLAGVNVRDIAVSRDGSRIVVVTEVAGEVNLRVASISRDNAGAPSQVGDPIIVGQQLSEASDVAWIGPNTVAVLARSPSGSESGMFAVQIGGPTSHLAAPYSGSQKITAGRDDTSIIALTDKQEAYSREGGAWGAVATSVTAVAYPG
ncbi:MAG: LpqB family beta-propeller domain-containing protein [Actinomycetaceae bacterium]|nr:LpqB family beta-propeller domain-containing protein [Actinomycetaceae bacterium]